RTRLENALQDIAPHIESKKVNKETIAESHEAVNSLYAESIQRAINSHRAELNPCADRKSLHLQAKQLLTTLQHSRGQILALERAIQVSENPALQVRLQRQLKNALALYFMNAARQYFMMETALTTPRGSDSSPLIWAELSKLAGDQNEELVLYLDSLRHGIDSISFGMNLAMESITNDPMHRYEYGDLMPLFSPWVKQLREHALGLANVLFKTLSSTSGGQGTSNTVTTRESLDDIFESSLYLVDVNDKLIAHGFDAHLVVSLSNRTDPHASPLEDLQQRLSTLGINTTSDSTLEDLAETTEQPVENSSNQSRKKIQYVEKLLALTPFAHFEKLNSSSGTFHPDTVLASATQAMEQALRLKTNLQRQLGLGVAADMGMAESVENKITMLDEAMSRLNISVLQTDLYKHYPFPQTRHWAFLLEGNQVTQIGKPQSLASQTEHLYEIEIIPTRDSQGRQPEPVYLHLHLKRVPALANTQALIGALLRQPNLIEAAHLKSSFYRNKGKTWESNQQARGQYEKLVKRSQINTEFLTAMEGFLNRADKRPLSQSRKGRR
ncbi:MAG TPA: hypothetical protein VFV39_02300, partial [Limnobacter sp.]|nr:hypothetical protein [Limnobacter sp.]